MQRKMKFACWSGHTKKRLMIEILGFTPWREHAEKNGGVLTGVKMPRTMGIESLERACKEKGKFTHGSKPNNKTVDCRKME